MTLDTIFYTQLASLTSFIVSVFVLYRVLVSQKDATIQLLKEKNSYLSRQLQDASQNSPDALARSLSERVKLLDGEIDRLSKDKESNQGLITEKEKELFAVKEEANELNKKIAKAHELMEEFFCPICSAPMAERAYQSESIEYSGREIDIDHEFVAYECGYTLIDGTEENPCNSNKPKTKSKFSPAN